MNTENKKPLILNVFGNPGSGVYTFSTQLRHLSQLNQYKIELFDSFDSKTIFSDEYYNKLSSLSNSDFDIIINPNPLFKIADVKKCFNFYNQSNNINLHINPNTGNKFKNQHNVNFLQEFQNIGIDLIPIIYNNESFTKVVNIIDEYFVNLEMDYLDNKIQANKNIKKIKL